MSLVHLRRGNPPPRQRGIDGKSKRVLLVELPFKGYARPSIGLSLLKASLDGAGYSCHIRYFNLEFAALIGLDAYRFIAEDLPQPLLIGDLIFAPALDKRMGRHESLRDHDRPSLAEASPLLQLPEWLWQRLPELQKLAAAFVVRCAEELAQSDAEIIGFSCMFQTLPSIATAKVLKALAPDKVIVFGGTHCEGDMGLALHQAYPFIDFVGCGEGERLLVDLVSSLSGHGPELSTIQGLVRRESGRSLGDGANADRIADLDALPRTNYDDWFEQIRRAAPTLTEQDLELPIEASRGCWYGQKHHCTFCGLNGETLTFRSKSAARVYEDIQALNRYGVPFLMAVDLIFDHRYFDTLLPMLANDSVERCIFFETKSNLTRRQLELLRDARIRMIQPGIESLSTPVLQLMRKGVSAYQNVRLLKWAAELGIAVFWSLLYGFPREEPEHYRAIAELIPALVHLNPPLGAYPVRIDRFSPMYFEGPALGVPSFNPAPAYGLVHPVAEEFLERLAYHFEYAEERRFDYVEPVGAALQTWTNSVGRASFTGLNRGDTLHLFDRRPIATEPHARLEGIDRAIYLACDAGARASTIAADLKISETEVRSALDRFVEKRWVAELDGRSVSLAVMLDGSVPESLPELLLPSLCHSIYVKRQLSLGRFLPAAPVPQNPHYPGATLS